MFSDGVSNEALLDLTRTTLQNLPKMTFETALDYQNYIVCNQWFKADKQVIDSGTSIERNIVLDTTGNAAHIRPYQKRSINVADLQKKITAPWTIVETYWSVERHELMRNRAPARYVNLIQSRRQDALIDLANLLEQKAFATPLSDSDDLNPRGLPYWLSMREAGSSGSGFDAYRVRWGDGSSTATKGGLDGSATGNEKWKNYAFTYDSVSGQFVKRMARAFHATKFVAPMFVTDLQKGPASKFRIYMGLDTLVEYEDLCTKANDNIGPDLAPYHGNTSFKKIPVTHAPLLDSATYSPVYGVNHDKFFPYILEGDWMREDGPLSDVEQHDTQTTFVSGTYQFFCKNVREAGFVGHTVTA